MMGFSPSFLRFLPEVLSLPLVPFEFEVVSGDAVVSGTVAASEARGGFCPSVGRSPFIMSSGA